MKHTELVMINRIWHEAEFASKYYESADDFKRKSYKHSLHVAMINYIVTYHPEMAEKIAEQIKNKQN